MSALTRPTHIMVICTYLLNRPQRVEQSNPYPRELKRASWVQMFLKGYKHRDIQEVLEVSPGFIRQETKLYKLLVYLG